MARLNSTLRSTRGVKERFEPSAIAQLEARSLDTVQLGTVRRYFEALGYELTVGVVPLRSSAPHDSR